MSGSRIIVPIALVICALATTPLPAQECTMNESATFVPLNGEEGDRFGETVAISDGQHGLRVVIGAPRENDEFESVGAAHVFRYDEKTFAWVQEARLVNPDPEHSGWFAFNVGMDGETIVVGKPFDDELADDAGAAYVYRFEGGEWIQEVKLFASDGRRNHNFGRANDIAGDTIVVGSSSRAAYVFRYVKGEWVEEAILRPKGSGDSGFGRSVDIAGDRIIVGAPFDSENASYAGAAYVFRFDGASWIREAKLLAEDGGPDDRFGHSVAIDGDQALIGARFSGDGAAYVFRFDRKSGQWRQERKLIPPKDFERFGQSVALSGELAAIASDSNRDTNPDADSVFVFRRDDGAPVATLRAEGGISRDGFGSDVAIAGATLIVGALNEAVGRIRPGVAHVFHDIFADCDDNGRPDLCDIYEGTSPDCNDNGVLDACDIERGSSKDANKDGLPDECQGACCALEGTCQSWVPEGECTARYTPDTTCEELNSPCTEAIGACCEDNGRCTEDFPFLQCGGRFIEGGACGDFWPQCIQRGACCDRQGSCEDDVPRGECSERFVPFERCADLDPPCGEELGACCVAGDCMDTNRFAECEEQSGIWFEGETCDSEFECPLEQTCHAWDNDIHANEFSGRAISPPNFPDIRVADDFVIPEGGCAVRDVQLFVMQDAGWSNGSGDITITVYADTNGNGPGEIVARVTTYYEQEWSEDKCGWGRDCYVYLVSGLDISLPGGSYWLGVRNPQGTGSGTNYWMTSDGGMDGGESDTGWFSLNAGQTWMPEGANWHHAFEINASNRLGACCHPDGTCDDDVLRDNCGEDRFTERVACVDLEEPCAPICPVSAARKIASVNRAERSHFGASVAMSGRTMVVGMDREQSGRGLKAAHVYALEGRRPTWQARLEPLSQSGEDEFGTAVAISGKPAHLIVVGAKGDDLAAQDAGAVYVFENRGGEGEWFRETVLRADDAAGGDFFGQAVAVSSDVIVVGAPFDRDQGYRSGSVYVFRFHGDQWRQEQKLLAHGGGSGDGFGTSVDVEDDLIVIGSPYDDGGGSDSGAVYTYRFQRGLWTFDQKLLAEDAAQSDYFGTVSLSGDALLVGANGDDDNGGRSGSGYVFRYVDGAWRQEAKLVPENGMTGARLGTSVSIDGETAVLGAPFDSNHGNLWGLAYVFQRRAANSWQETAQLIPRVDPAGGEFGLAVAVSGSTVLVGAPRDSSMFYRSGAAYVYRSVSTDCNDNGVADACDIAQRRSFDRDANGLADECEGVCCVGDTCVETIFDECEGFGCVRDPAWLCDGDVDGDGQVNPVDVGLVAAAFGSIRERNLCSYDLDCNGRINPTDVGIVQSLFGLCNDPRSACGAGRWTEGVDCGDFECP